jgi:hypothetical protein
MGWGCLWGKRDDGYGCGEWGMGTGEEVAIGLRPQL